MSEAQDSGLYLAWTTCETREIARTLARASVEAQLAACVQISGPIESFYRWEGKVEVGEEYRVLFKVHFQTLEALYHWLKKNHPYKNPQWYAVKADTVAPDYLKWVSECC